MAKTLTVSKRRRNTIGGTKHTVLSILATVFFLGLSLIIAFPLFAGLLASFRPGRELIRKKLGLEEQDAKAQAMTITLLLNSEGKKMGKTQS